MLVHSASVSAERNDNLRAADSFPEGSFLSVKDREGLQSKYSC